VKRVLVADDDADSRAVARDALVMAGYEVLEAVDGLDALSQADRARPDLVFLDLSMPRLDGWEAARKLKAGACAGTPVVAYTAHALAGDAEKALAAGCDDYLAKPCAPREVVRKAEKWTGGDDRQGGHP
jgi:two-component system cell cycle response regulator DivK